MSSRIALHADDLALHPAVDRAVLRLHAAGAIGGASILVTGPTFSAAASEARRSGLRLSLHLALVDTEPASSPGEVPSLVGPDGRFPARYGDIVLRWLRRRPRPDELRREIRAQLDRFAQAGLISDRGLELDGHQHLHLLPGVLETLLEEGASFGLRRIRLPALSPTERGERSPRGIAFRVLERLGRRAGRLADAQAVGLTPCWGVLYAGRLTLRRAEAVIRSLPSRAAGQLICHPGDDDVALAACRDWGYAWETELATALRLRARGVLTA
jgi:predicted glycoside hydrolase/deacetylase ChbG (UPF0249 family)